MRVGIDLTPLRGRRTGVGHYVWFLLKHLATEDIELQGFSSGIGGPVTDFPAALSRYRHLPIPTRALYKLWGHTARPKIDRLLPGIDVYHATNYFLPPVATAKRIVTFHDLAFLRHPEWASPKIVGPFSGHVRRHAAEADRIIACSQATRNDAMELLGVPESRIQVIYEAVDPAFQPWPHEEAAAWLREQYGLEPPFMLFVGTLEPRKNILNLLRAFHTLGDLPHRLVLIGGAGWYGEELERVLADLQLGDRLVRIGYVPQHSDLAAFYGLADVFAFPSFYEGFGLPLLEAFTCGCPAVTSRVSSLPEVAGDAGVYVDPQDPADIARGLREVIEDASLRQTLVTAAHGQVQRFSWNETARQTLAAYREVTGCM
ncbi:MAG: glycosyltransferase family 4 protein [Candidatus Hydrogenedentes bacterium]|nr:glycosyltransferase family 4 protein [Candidatus Hydrogenedentota bacterium]